MMKPKAKYDWVMLKDDFYRSEYLDVSAWIRGTLGEKMDTNNAIRRATLGWTKSKKMWKEDILKERARLYEENHMEAAKKLLNRVFAKIESDLKYIEERDSHDTEDTKRIWEMARTEAGMETKISFSRTEDVNFDKEKAKQELLDELKLKHDKPKRITKRRKSSGNIQRYKATK